MNLLTRHTVSLTILLLLTSFPVSADDNQTLQETADQAWYKGNMHTHSLWSDGDDYPEMIADWYKQHGYNFLVFTDHNTLHNHKRWIDVEKNKGGLVAFTRMVERFGEEHPDVREIEIKAKATNEKKQVDETDINTDESATSESIAELKIQTRKEVRLQTFDETFKQFASPGEYILIQGEEISDRYGSKPIHMCAANTSGLLPPMGGDSVYDVIQNNINAAISRRERSSVKTLVHLNHPNFGYAITAEQLMKVQGENFFEVFNGHPSVHDAGDATHASTERMWDIINTFRLSELQLPLMYGLATDDGHNYHKTESGKGAQPGRGWVNVLSGQLDPDSLVESLEAGRFYSSSGVSLQKIVATGSSLHVEVEPSDNATYSIQFIGTRKGFDTTSKPMSDDAVKAEGLTRQYSNDIGAVLKTADGVSATYEFQGDELYVRAVITSSQQHPNPSVPNQMQQAWVQPVVPATEARQK